MSSFDLLSLKEEVISGINVDIDRGGGSSKEWGPIPPVVFGIEEEVRSDDCNADHNNKKKQHHEHHEAVHVVYFVRPERSKNEVHLNEDGTKGKQTAQGDDDPRFHEPFLFGDGSRHSVDTAGEVGLAGEVSAQHGAHQREGQDDESAEADHGEHDGEGDGSGGVVIQSNEIDAEGRGAN